MPKHKNGLELPEMIIIIFLLLVFILAGILLS